MIEFREPRRQVRLAAQLRCGEGWRRIAITNVTTTGLRCQCSNPPEPGSSVDIRYKGFSIVGSVQWCEAQDFGVTCEDTVDVELLVAGSPEVDVGRRALPRLEVRFPARFAIDDRGAPVVVHDISPGGARLSMQVPPRRGEHGVIQWDGVECECTVVWAGENSFGVIFGNELPAQPPPPRKPAEVEAVPTSGGAPQGRKDGSAPAARKDRVDRRGKPRVAVNWSCKVHHPESRRIQVQISNISTSGCVVGWFAGCRSDVPLYVELPNLSPVKAKIVWKGDRKIGCHFDKPLNSWVLEHLLAQQFA